jgi:hypothetical protein
MKCKKSQRVFPKPIMMHWVPTGYDRNFLKQPAGFSEKGLAWIPSGYQRKIKIARWFQKKDLDGYPPVIKELQITNWFLKRGIAYVPSGYHRKILK